MAIATLTIDIDARLAGLQTSLNKAAQEAEKSSRRMQSAFSSAGVALAGLTAGLLAVSAARMAVGFATDAIELAARLDDVSEATGASVENLSKLQYQARISGQEFEGIEKSLTKFSVKLLDLKDPASDASLALKAIGLSAKDLEGLDTAEKFQKVAQALAKYADGGGKVAAAQALMGKGAAEQIAYLNDLGNAGEIAATVFTKQSAEAEKLQKAWAKLKVDAETGFMQVVLNLLPNVDEKLKEHAMVMGKLKDVYAGFRDFVGLGTGDPLKDATAGAAKASAAYDALHAKIQQGEKDGGLGFGMPETRLKNLEFARAKLENLKEASDKAAASLKSLRAPADTAEKKPDVGFTPTDDAAARKAAAEKLKRDNAATAAANKEQAQAEARKATAERYIADLSKQNAVLDAQLASNDNLSASEKRLIEHKAALADGTLKLTAAENERAVAFLTASADAEKSIALKKEETKAAQDQLQVLHDEAVARDKLRDARDSRVDTAIYGTDANGIAQMSGDLKELKARLQDGRITLEEYKTGVQGLSGQTKKAAEDTAAWAEVAAASMATVLTASSMALINGGDGLKDFGKQFEAEIQRMIVQTLVVMPILKALQAQMMTMGGGDKGSVFSMMGTAIGGMFGGGKASGGAVNSGQFYEVNEQGPELLQTGGKTFLMGATGNVVPLKPQSNAGGGGGVSVNVTNTGTAQDVKSVQQSFDSHGAVVNIVLDDIRRGGPLRSALGGR